MEFPWETEEACLEREAEWRKRLEPLRLRVLDIFKKIWLLETQQLDDAACISLTTTVAEAIHGLTPQSESDETFAHLSEEKRLYKAASTFLHELESSPYYRSRKSYGFGFINSEIESVYCAVEAFAEFTAPMRRDLKAEAKKLATLIEQAWRRTGIVGIENRLGRHDKGKLTQAVEALLAVAGIPKMSVRDALDERRSSRVRRRGAGRTNS